MGRVATVSAGVLAALMLACDEVESEPEAAQTVEWSIDSVPTFRVGGHDERPTHVLHNVVAVTRLSDGRIAIANAGTSEIRFYDASAQLVGVAGGDGDGPGELRYIHQMVKGVGDSLIVMSRNPGLTWYDPAGEYVRSARMRNDSRPATHPCRYGEGDSWTVRPDGQRLLLLRDDFSPSVCPQTPEGPWRRTGLLGVPRGDFNAFDTILLMPADERVGSRYRVFGHDLLLGFASDRVYAIDTDSDDVLGISYSGDTVLVAATPYPARQVPESVKDESLLEVRQPDGSTRFVPGYSHYPETFPRVGRVLVDSEDHLWLMEYPLATEPFNTWRLARARGQMVPSQGASWTVMNADGVTVATLTSPPDLFVMEIGSNYVLGVKRDEFDVETVEMYELHRSAANSH
ncbi:MAG: hypothetical protein HKN72_08400 [Gemmatimonadetes bacterium]|nr:hypothetical protein [Gemmatimonadota bacterium]